jgi:hypothetical protein
MDVAQLVAHEVLVSASRVPRQFQISVTYFDSAVA